jgi:hypothetical protein
MLQYYGRETNSLEISETALPHNAAVAPVSVTGVGMHSQTLFLKSIRKSIDYGFVIRFSRLSVARS